MNKLITLSLLILFSACNNRITDSEKNIESADAAYDQFDLKKSNAILESMLLIDTLQNEQKCEVLRRLAHQDWKYYKNYDLAKKRLMKADSIGVSKFDTWVLINRMERESLNYDNSLNAAIEAEKSAKSENENNLAKIEFAQTVYEFSVDLLEKNQSLDTNLLTNASKTLSSIVESNAGMPKPSKLLLGISLLLNDGENVQRAWQSYFHVQNIKNTYSYLLNSAEKLSQVCEKWHGEKLGLAEQETLIEALASSRFYENIPVYIKANPLENYNQKIKDIITYSEYLQEVKKETNEYYRLIAIEKESERSYKKWLDNKRKELWNNLSFLSQETYNENDFLVKTEKHFGAKGFTGSTGNYSGYVLCLGHIVIQEKATVKQYGYEPEFTYTQIDMMTSNGYSSWFWEDKAIGGWATENEIIRVREVYLNSPFAAWKTISDSIEKQKTEKIVSAFLNNSSVNQLELSDGLAAKLKFDALNDLYDKLTSNGLTGQELKLAFLSEYEQSRIEASLIAHEGRHSIEKKYMPEEFEKWDNEERELHAKLSQVIFAPEPRYELAGMVSGTCESGHDMANKRITEIAVNWIKNNKEKLIGFSELKSEFSQIYLMSNEQIKECYKQADPLNK